jgi:hypothetical protein
MFSFGLFFQPTRQFGIVVSTPARGRYSDFIWLKSAAANKWTVSNGGIGHIDVIETKGLIARSIPSSPGLPVSI